MSEGGADAPERGGEELLEAMREHPGGRELLKLAGERDDGALVGGATRDLLLGRSPRELDVVVREDAAGFARELAARLDPGAEVSAHGRFGTATVSFSEGTVDVAERRAESYPQPGALPEVRAGDVEQDLLRRDFTVNAIAAPMAGLERGCLLSAPHALEDLSAGALRVMHERSFIDDPTRILRLARYSARLGFAAEPRTAELAAEALAQGALATLSRARVGAELRLALGEREALEAIEELQAIGALAAIEPALRLHDRLTRRALELLPSDGRPDLLLLAVLLLGLVEASHGASDARSEIFELLEPMEFPAGDRERAMRSALLAPTLLSPLHAQARPSQVRDALANVPLEAVALAAALASDGAAGAAALAQEWLSSWRRVSLQISGDDLLAAGVPAGPEIGGRLARALARRLDGELEDGREAELQAALEAGA